MNKLDKTYTDLIGNAYKGYADSHNTFVDGFTHVTPMAHSKESFIEAIKTDDEFSEKWGLKIEERELSLEERQKLCIVWTEDSYGVDGELRSPLTIDWEKTPKRAITITYNNEKIESYE